MTCAPAYVAGIATLPVVVILAIAALLALFVWRLPGRLK